ncbi:MAG: glycoside hydrolase family 13 protein [Chloroflexi bacterium]|nr:glycoside hydrolase family 13 protein [Chloroflexota bacterium]
MNTPTWVKNAVFYQIFPDRFNRSSRIVHERGIKFKAWGSPPEEQGYQGGDLYGIVDKLDYIKEMGINALYLNPIFSAASNHRYNAYDFMEVDPLLGGEPALRELLDEAHKRNIRVVLDGVFNHCGRGFRAFNHILENGGNSPYIDWFTIEGFPLHAYSEDGTKPNYASWWNHASLPKFNTKNPGVRDYIFKVARHWLEFGMDGWRLDVPEEIQDDSFWREFRQVVKSVNPDAYIVGEIWHEAAHWLQGDMFDAVMNYQLTGPVLNFFGAASLNKAWEHADVKLKPINAEIFKKDIDTMFGHYDWEINYAQMNMIDSHDMPRALWLVNNDKAAHQLVVLCQMTLPGAPCVYYGDEVGLSAGTDPYCREAFPWDKPERWDALLRKFYRDVIALRNSHEVLRTGDFSFIHARDKVAAYRRKLGNVEAVISFNAGKTAQAVNLSAQELGHSTYSVTWPLGNGTSSTVRNDAGLNLEIPPQSAIILIAGEN